MAQLKNLPKDMPVQEKPRLVKHKYAIDGIMFGEMTQEQLNDDLFQKVRYGRIKDVKILLGKGANPNARDALKEITALMKAAIQEQFDICTLLIENGADIEAKTSYNWTALMVAAYKGHTKICKLLIEKGANVGARDNLKRTARMIALEQKSTATALFLENMEFLQQLIGNKSLKEFLSGFKGCISGGG
jgi:ankyrin repeat protein